MSIAPFVKIKKLDHIVYKNTIYQIKDSRSNIYYKMLINKTLSRGIMETVYSKQFRFPNTATLWRNIYTQKTIIPKLPKLCEFNYKVLHNLIPCAKQLCKWKKIESDRCTMCGKMEDTKHMLFNCHRVRNIWQNVSDILNVNISWKQIVCGFPCYELKSKVNVLNYLFTIISYAIFKQTAMCRNENLNYGHCNLVIKIRAELKWYVKILNILNECHNKLFITYCEKLYNLC